MLFACVVTSFVLDFTKVLACSGVKYLKKEKKTLTCVSVFGKHRSADGPGGVSQNPQGPGGRHQSGLGTRGWSWESGSV